MHITFISHDASRTGAPFSLITIAQWLHQNTNSSCSFIVQRTGPLIHDMKKIGDVVLLSDLQKNPAIARHILQKTSLLYANTAASHQSLDILQPHNIPIIAHIHELEYAIQVLQGDRLWHRHPITHYIAASDAVRMNLIHRHSIPETAIETIYEAIPTPKATNTSSTRMALREKLGINQGDFVIGACGSIEWRKGPDLFLSTATEVKKRSPNSPIQFVWIGAAFHQAYANELFFEQQKRKLDTVHFVGPRINPIDYFTTFDTFFLPSREDPFPLVMLMAASLRQPTICFADAGGAPEFAQHDAGYIIPFGDTGAAAETILNLFHTPSERQARGDVAYTQLMEGYTIDVVGPQILSTISRVMNNSI